MKNYEQIKVLGEGGFGKAILARQKSDNKRCVIKEVRLSSLSPKDRNEAQKEAKVLASLKHPNIVDYITSFQERGCFYIVMEFADGGDLSQKIEKRKHKLFSENEILHDFIQIALAIKYIHDRKILHRDLKTQNIFLMKDGQVKLGDFGIARVLEHTFQLCRTQIGTPYYLSPEICEGKNYNAKTDIWSLGCILYELCTLQHAFQGGNMQGLMMNICRGRFSPISSSYSADLKNLVTSMLTKDPLKRPSINTILTLPFIKSRLNSLLEKTILDYEFSHTILHGRKPFAAPTIVLSKNENLSIENNQNNNNNNNNDDNNNNQNGNINNNMNNGNNGYKSPARGNDSRNNRNPPPSQNNRQPSNRQPSNRQPARQQMPRNLPSGADPRYYRRQQAAAAAAEPNADPRYNRQRQPNNNQNAEEQRKQYEEELKLAQEAEERRILEERKRKEIRDEEDRKRRERDDDERRIIEQRRQQINEERRKKMKEEEEKRMEQELERRRILEEKRKQAIAEAKKQKEIEEFKRIAKERERQKARQAEEERRKQIELEKQRKKEEMRKQWEREEEQRKQEEQRRLEEKKKADERRRQEYLERKKFEEQLEEKKKEERRQKMLEMEEERRQYEEFERQKREEEIQRKKELAEQQRKRREEEEEMKRREEEKRKQRVQEQLREREELEAERIKMAEEEKARKRAMIQKQRELREEQRRIEEEKRKRNIEELNQCDGIFGEKQPDIQYQPKQIYKGSPSRLNNNRGRESPNPNDDFLIGGDRPAWATPAQNKPPPPKQQRRRERPAWVSPSEDFSVLNQSPPKQTPSPNPVQKPKRQSRMPQSDGYDSSSSESYDRPIGRNNLNTRPAWVNNSEDYADALPKPQSPPQRQPRRSPQNRQPKPNQQKENHQRETPQENESDRFIDEHVAEEPSWAKMPPKRVSIEPLEQNEAQKESSAQSQNDKPKSFDEMSVEERNAYAKQLRHEAAANRKKAMQLEAKSSEDDVSNVNRQQPQKNQQVTREQQPKPQINLANKKFDDMTNEERNEYMRQLRHEAQANKQKANQRVVGSDLPEEPSSQPKSNPPPQSNIVNKKFDDMTNEERNEYMRQLRHEAQANKQKANQRVVGSDLPDESYSQQEQKPQRQEQPMQNLANKKFDDMTNEERNEYMRQLRHEAQANKQKANQRVVGADIPEEPSYQQQLQQPKPQSNLANKKFDDMTNEERNEYMRQLRHEAQANKQKANQRVVGSDLPDESYSQQEQKPQRQEQPMQNLANKKFDDMTNEERNEYMRQIRHEAQANKNRAKQLQVGPPADNVFENRNKAPNGKMVNPDFYKPNQQRNDSPSKVERIAKHEISEEDRRRIYEEQRAAFKSYRNRGRLLDNGADMKEAIEDSSYQPEPYKDERIAKHEISEEDRRKIYEEQRAAFKAYRNRGRLFDNGADMKEAIEDSSYQPEPYKDERIAKHEISEADRRKIYEEQRAAFKSYRNRGRLLDNGSDMKEAIEDSSYQPEPYKDERIAKHEISEADRRRIYEEQRAAFKSYRNRGRLFDNGADMKEAIEDPGYQPEPYKDERIAKHEISEADRRKIYEEQHAAFKKYKNRGRVVDSFVEDEPPSGNNYDNNNSKYNNDYKNDYQNNVYNQNDNDYNDYDNKNDRYDNNDNKNYDYNNNDNNNDDYYNDNNDDYYYNDDNDNDNNYNNDNYYNDEYKDDYNDNFNNNNNNNDDYNDNYNNDYKDDKDFEESIQEQLPQWARAPTKREKLPKQIHAAGSPRFYEEVGNDDDDDNVDDEPISVSRQNTASNFVENRKAQNNRPQRKIQLDSDDEAYNTNEEENDIHLPESGKSTMDFDELKKSARIFNSPKEDILKNVDIDAPKELHKHAKKMAKLHDLAMSLKEALELPEKHNFEDDFEDFDDDQQLQQGRQKQQQQVFYIDDKEVVFPIASDKESMQFRIESMRNYLEKQIGLQKLIALNNELINKSKDDATPTPIISDLSPGLVCLAEQLLVIDTPNRP